MLKSGFSSQSDSEGREPSDLEDVVKEVGGNDESRCAAALKPGGGFAPGPIGLDGSVDIKRE